MNIDAAFGTIGHKDSEHYFDKGHYCLGTISTVSNSGAKIQIENLSILQGRVLNNESIFPNSVNFLVLIDDQKGLFIGRVNYAAIKDSDSIHVLMKSGQLDRIHPEEDLEVLAVCNSASLNFSPSGFNSVGIHDKVYIAPPKVVSMYLKSLELLEDARSENPLPVFANLSNSDDSPVALKPVTLFSRHMMVIGTTGSGKSTSALSIIDALIKSGIKVLMIDPTGEYKDSFSSDEVEKLALGKDTYISPGSLSMNQWIGLFNASSGIQAPALVNAIKALRYQKKNCQHAVLEKKFKQYSSITDKIKTLNSKDTAFDLDLLTDQLMQEAVQENSSGKMMPNDFKLNAIRMLTDRPNQKMETDGLKNFFSDVPDNSLLKKLDSFLANHRNLYINASQFGAGDDTGGMIIDLISKYLNRMKNELQDAFVMFIDEVHRYTTKEGADREAYYQGLNILAREGRKQGIYLLLTTQSPNDVSKLVLSQMGTLLIHRLTQSDELYAIKNFIDDRARARVPYLGQGDAVLSSVNLIQNIEINILKSGRMHHNSSPSLWLRNDHVHEEK
ncbi:ATP-binding protein [Oenococcus sicerae]|uniref:ATP-binding protein n=1 Tax=Oenococcus sicerae TaxID=2203724 RepID=A0AAJ1RBS2_9LACO|nr:ATP-binding protein [Oenococcus sicerae]MDN6899862.1 ATP-binding protein [Oenococcus sicerae]